MHSEARHPTAMIGLAAAAGALAGLAWLPLGLAPLLPVAFLLAMLGLERAHTMGDAVRFGVVFGVLRYAVAAHFLLALLAFSPLAIAFYAMAIVFALPFAIFESTSAVWLERKTGLPRSVGFAIAYTLGEWLRTKGDLSFPADLLAHAFGTAPEFLAWSPVIGPHGVTLAIGLAAAAMLWAWSHRDEPRRAMVPAALALLLWFGPPLTSLAIDDAPEPRATAPQRALRVGIVQPCFAVEEKLDPDYAERLWARLERLTIDAARSADLIVWPESARPGRVAWDAAGPFTDPVMEKLAHSVGVPILYGAEIVRMEGGRAVALYNGAALVHPDGTPAQWYGKQRLLPFAEGVPFARLVGWDPLERAGAKERSFLTLLGNFSPGPEPTIFRVGDARIGVLICYEGFYPQLARRYRLEGANALVAITNDAWWGKSLFAPWHARMVATRARENDLPVLRAANNGVSSLTDISGTLQARTEIDALLTLDVTLAPSSSPPTVYAQAGDVLVGALAACVSVLAAWSFARGAPLLSWLLPVPRLRLVRDDEARSRRRRASREDAA